MSNSIPLDKLRRRNKPSFPLADLSSLPYPDELPESIVGKIKSSLGINTFFTLNRNRFLPVDILLLIRFTVQRVFTFIKRLFLMKKNLLFLAMLLFAFQYVDAADYYTTSASATLTGNATASANWTTNPNGITGLTSVTITATDNLIVLNGGTATITNTGTMTVASLTINTGGTIVHNNNAWSSAFTITGPLTWNGTIRTLQATSGTNFFNANGDVTGATAIHHVNSTRGVYLGGTNKTISLTQLSTGVTSSSNISVGLQLNGSYRSLAGNCKFYSPLVFNGVSSTLDLAGYNLQVSSIKQGNTATRLLKGHANSNLTISGTSATLPSNAATIITFDPAAALLNQLNINSSYLSTAAGSVTVNGNLSINALTFGTASGDNATRTLQVNGNFTLANNGSLRVQAGGTTAGSTYDQVNATGDISIGTSTTLKVDFINAYSTPDQPFLNFVQTTSPAIVAGTFGTILNTSDYTSDVTYPGNAVKYQLLTSPAPAAPCPISLTPDLPLLPSSATIEAEINTIVQRFSDAYLGTTEPTSTALTTAITNYNALNITVEGYSISAQTAVTSYSQTAFLKTFAQYLKFHPEDNDVFTKALNTVWLVSDRMCKGLFEIDYNQYVYRDFARSAILIPRIKDNSFVKSLFENVLYQQDNFLHFWDPNYVVGINDDHLGNSGNVTMAYVKWIESADERYRYMTAFKRFIENFTRYAPGNSYAGIKQDGSGFHHWTGYPSYTSNLNSVGEIISNLRETSFQIDSAAYLRLRDAIMAQLMFTNDNTTRFLTMGGRKPEEIATTISRFSLRNMGVAGGSILGTDTSDPVIATYYNRVWGGYAPFGNSLKASFNSGYFQFNHSMAGIYRNDGWLAVCKGFNNNMLGSEIYPDANRFGRYQSYGAVNIIYPGDALTGNGYDVTTWDWNFTPGATVIRLPWNKLHGEKQRIDELQQKRFVGSLSFINKNGLYLNKIQGTYGLFAMDFQEKTGQGFGTVYSSENHNATFVFKKSVFAFDNMLICLGSNIGNNDAVNTTMTTLYQRKTSAAKEQVIIDDNLLPTGTYNNTYTDSDNHWVVDNYNTGFYVFAGSGTIRLSKGDQQTPQHNKILSAQTITNNPVGNYAKGFLDHGTAPSNKSYEYICMPNATATTMVDLNNQISAGNKPYTVHRQDGIAHIVEYKPAANTNAIFGYAFFSALSGINNNGLLSGADYPCLVMSKYDTAQKTFQIAVNNPDLGYNYRSDAASVTKLIKVAIKGTNWEISQTHANASIIDTANGETIIQFTTKDGLPVEIVLSRVLNPQTISFDPIAEKATTDTAFVLTAIASSGMPVSYTSSNTAVADISDSTVVIVGKGTAIITASQKGNDFYDAATSVQTLTVKDVEPPVLNAPDNVNLYTDAGISTASNVSLGTATASDNDELQSVSNNAPAIYPVGVTEVTWTATDVSGNITTAMQLVTVTDNEVPVLIAPAAQEVCYEGSNYQVPVLSATDNVGIATIHYIVSGATERSGAGINASGSFDEGVSIITWTVTDMFGSHSTAVCTVTINHRLTVNIADVFAVNAAIDLKNTLYLGYGPSSFSITATPQGGGGEYRYSWSTGEQTQSITVADAGTYTVTVTDLKGCQISATIQINVLDVRCGNKGNKVRVCHNNKSICISSEAIQDHLSHGDALGECGVADRRVTTTSESNIEIMKVFPNPVQDMLFVSVHMLNKSAQIQVYNAQGMLVRNAQLVKTNQGISLSGLAAGIYLVHVKNGLEITRKKIIKL
jgi:hypothetical protein